MKSYQDYFGVLLSRGLLACPVLLELSAASLMLMYLSFLQCIYFFLKASGRRHQIFLRMMALFQGPDKFGLGLEDLGNLSFHRFMSLLVSISEFHFLMLYGLLSVLVFWWFFFKLVVRGFVLSFIKTKEIQAGR